MREGFAEGAVGGGGDGVVGGGFAGEGGGVSLREVVGRLVAVGGGFVAVEGDEGGEAGGGVGGGGGGRRRGRLGDGDGAGAVAASVADAGDGVVEWDVEEAGEDEEAGYVL